MLGSSEHHVQPYGVRSTFIRLRGAGAAAPVVEVGPGGRVATAAAIASGVTMTRQGVGQYTLALKEKLGVFLGAEAKHAASTPSATTPRHLELEEDASFAGAALTMKMLHITPATDTAAAAASDMAATDVWYLWLHWETVSP